MREIERIWKNIERKCVRERKDERVRENESDRDRVGLREFRKLIDKKY